MIMRLGDIILLAPVTIAFPTISSSQIWLASLQHRIKNIIDNPLRRSTIPQFILDTEHPWVVANKRKLEQLSNADVFLCSDPDVGLYKSKGLETKLELEIPTDLFHSLRIDNNRVEVSRPGWANALERLCEMKSCQRALKEAKTLEIDVYVYREDYFDTLMKMLEPSQPPEQLLTLFGDVLESMTNLEKLEWNIPKEDTHFFEESFKSRNLTLPSIKHLEPGPSSHYLVGMCPNLVELQNGGSHSWYDGYMPDNRNWGLMLVQATVSTPKLKRFAMVGGRDGWTPLLVSEVVRCMPQIESLGLLGSLGRAREYTGIDTGDSGQLKDTLDVLTGLANLTHLDLPDSSHLGLGFNGGPGCGNAYFGKKGRLRLRQITREYAEATELGGHVVVANLPHLTSFTIGGQKPNITWNNGRIVNATWPWTGRMDEWLKEMVPLDDAGTLGLEVDSI